MNTPQTNSQAAITNNPERWETLDATFAKALIGFILRAPKRHLRLSILTLLLGLAVSAAAVVYYPRLYHVETRILAQQNLVIPLLGNPHRTVPVDYGAATRAANELILQHDNLLAIIDELDLLRKWREHRAPILKLKDQIMEAVRGPVADEDMRRALVGLLENRLFVQNDGTTLTISADWGDPDTTFEIVATAQRNFLDRRATLELSVIEDTISILEDEAKKQEDDLAAALADVQRLRAAMPAPPAPVPTTTAPPSPGRPVVIAPKPAPAPAPTRNEDLAKLLAEKRHAIRELDEPRQRKIADLRARIEDLKGVYTPAHPIIVELEARLREASVESPEVRKLRAEEADLVARLAAETQKQPVTPKYTQQTARALTAAPRVAGAPIPDVAAAEEEESPELHAAREKLASALRKYDDLMNRIDTAQLEIHTTKAAFKYSYVIIAPPEIPIKPVKPNVLMLAVGGVFLSVALAIFAAAARDFTSGRFIEAWQVRRRLRIPVLAEVKSP